MSLVTHAGGLRLEKQSVGVTLETTNYIVQCTSLTSCRLLATANQVIPNEVAEIANPQFTDNEEGTVTVTGIAQLSAATALVLNTLFQTDIFHEGFQLGTVRSTFTYDVTEPGGYVRPRGATPLHVSLVPAYQECMVPTSQHGAPLSEPSCTPPLQNSPHLTVGTPDSNGAGAKSVADVLYKVQMGNDQTPEDEADVLIDVSATDIRNRTGLTDYTGELQAVFDLRVTDGANSLLPPLFPANESGTTQDTSFSVTVPCAATEDATVGSTCTSRRARTRSCRESCWRACAPCGRWVP